jgi:hypothetical protein
MTVRWLWGHRNFRPTVGKDGARTALAIDTKPLQSRRFGEPEKRNSKRGNTARSEPSRTSSKSSRVTAYGSTPLPAGSLNASARVRPSVCRSALCGERPAPRPHRPGGRAHAQRDEEGEDPEPGRNSDPQSGHRGTLPHAISTETRVARRADGPGHESEPVAGASSRPRMSAPRPRPWLARDIAKRVY